MCYFKQNYIFYSFQCGFREAATQLALLYYKTSKVCVLILRRVNNILGLYLDSKKSLDTVDYSNANTVNACNMLSSYLSNRRQCNFVHNTSSYYSDVITGVPQGSVWDP